MPETTSDILDQTKNTLERRYEDLKPLVEEFHKIQETLSSMDPSTHAPRRPSAYAPRGQRLHEFVAAVQKHPDGITVSQVMREVNAMTNYGYKLAEQALEKNLITKKGNLFFPRVKPKTEPQRPEMQEEPK